MDLNNCMLLNVPKDNPHEGRNCRDCSHVIQKPWVGNGSGWYYCTQKPTGRTECGIERVKALRSACRKFTGADK